MKEPDEVTGLHIKSFAYDNWHEEQQRFDASRTGKDVVIKPRQIGFSTMELARDLWFAVTKPGVNVLIISHDSDLVEQLFLTLKLMAACLADKGLLPATAYSNKREIVFKRTFSAVRVVQSGTTEHSAQKTGRSGTVHRLHVTELAFWGAAEETMAAVGGSVPDNGEIVIESTANGAGGLFYTTVRESRAHRGPYALHFYAWWQHKRYRKAVPAGFDAAPRDEWEEKLRSYGCDDEQIVWWRAKVDDPTMGLEKALQEYPCDVDTCFRAPGDAWLPPKTLDALALHICEPVRLAPIVYQGQRFESARVFQPYVRGFQYVIGADVAEGVTRDGSAAVVLERRSGAVAAVWWHDATEAGDFAVVLAVLGWMYGTALIAPERNNNGHATVDRLVKTIRYPNVYMEDNGRYGWVTDEQSRSIMFDDLGFALRERSTSTPDTEALDELRTIIRDVDGKPRARGKKDKRKDACRDDRIVGWGIAWQLRTRTQIRDRSMTGIHVGGV